ncbi:MAG: hypothetical protein ABH851_07830, partial [Methanobacteriota archaeon]
MQCKLPASLFILLLLTTFVSADSPIIWTIKSSSGSTKCPTPHSPVQTDSGPVKTIFDDHGMVTIAPGMVSATLACEGTHELILESQAFTHDPATTITFSAYLPSYSGSEVSLGVDGKDFKQISDPTWLGKGGGDCIKDLKLKPTSDPSSSGTPLFSKIDFPASAWEDGKVHKLALKVEKKDPGCPASAIVFGNISDAPESTTTTPQSRPTTTTTPKDTVQLYGKVTDGWGNPLKNMVLEFEVENISLSSSTDDEGEYVFEFMTDVDPGYYRQAVMTFVFAYEDKDGNTYFRILFDDLPVTVRQSFFLMSEEDLHQDFNISAATITGVPIGNPDFGGLRVKDPTDDYAAIYYHMTQALEYYKDYLGWRVDYKLPVDVRAFVNHKKPSTYYSSTYSTIVIDTKHSEVSHRYRPMNREWHEFGHHVMYSTYLKWPSAPQGSYPDEANHAGYINPSTSDSFIEGFAEFGSMMIAEHYGYKRPDVYSSFGSFEADYKAWENLGTSEEFAIAGILWDLVDPVNDDKVDLTDKQVFNLLKSYHKDFTSVYNALQKHYPQLSKEIDEIFISHGFFADRSIGNAKRDPGEPYVNYANKSLYVEGVEYVDYAMDGVNNTPGMVYNRSEKVGSATNYQRPDRTSAGTLPGHYVKATGDGVSYIVEVTFKDNP